VATAGIIFFLYASPTFRLFNGNNIILTHHIGIPRAYYYYYYYYYITIVIVVGRRQLSPLLLVGGRDPFLHSRLAAAMQKRRLPPVVTLHYKVLYFSGAGDEDFCGMAV